MTDVSLYSFFRSVLEQDAAPIVLCDLHHTIIYLNPAAKQRYQRYGHGELVGQSLLVCHNTRSCARIEQALRWFAQSVDHNLIYESYNPEENKDVYMIALRDEQGKLIGYYEKHEYRTRETGTPYTMPD